MATDNKCDFCKDHHEEVWYCTMCGSTDRDSLCTKCESKKREAEEPSCDWCGVPCECDGYEGFDEVLG